jgi:hydrogenase small subunit
MPDDLREDTEAMTTTIFWMQCGGCCGDTWSFFNNQSPNAIEFFDVYDLKMLWHPSLSATRVEDLKTLIDHLIAGDKELDIFCVEGTVLRGPEGTGAYDEILGIPKMEIVEALARKARYVVAVGTCACFGGISAGGEVDGTGLQYLRWVTGGLLGEKYRSRGGFPVINLPGCPCHCDVIKGTIMALAGGNPPELTLLNMPLEWYGIMVHQGCTRNEYHEYRVEDKAFGEKGCMFFHMGCHGPLVHGPCNKLLWNNRSSKTRIGVPCFGCTRPDFPQPYPFFETRNIEGIPIELPDGVSRAHYMAYKGMAAAAAPKRLIKRKTGI